LIRIGLLRPATDANRLLDLIRIRLDDTRFCAPVVSIALQADLAGGGQDTEKDLFGSRPNRTAGSLELLEQLRARLGNRAVHGIQRVPEHRPESAWKAVAPLDKTERVGTRALAGERSDHRMGHRPLWMLPNPLALETTGDNPVFQGVLTLEDGPERIETGWWDDGDIRRDYYIAQNVRGMRLWIFRDHRESRWYLHGLFG
jgi:protein ImuB